MKSNQERRCYSCNFVSTYNGEKLCILNELPLGPLFHIYGCTPRNFLETSEFEMLSLKRQKEVKDLLENN